MAKSGLITLAMWFYYILHIGVMVSGGVCYPKQDDFENLCTSNYGGVVDGGRCYFVDTSLNDWTTAWTTCGSRGGTLAQLHTLSASSKVNTLVSQNASFQPALMAARDDKLLSVCAGVCQGQPIWYDNETKSSAAPVTREVEYSSGLTVNLLKSRCFTPSWTPAECDRKIWHPVCQITNDFQTFTMTNCCMTEPPVSELVLPKSSTAQSCAGPCAKKVYCRSYNFILNGTGTTGNKCQLFSRSIDDCTFNTNMCPQTTAQTATCYHYNYVA